MRRTKRDARITIRLAEPLRQELAAEADQDGRTLAEYVRRLLVDVAVERLAEREQAAA
jgi:predicted DNA binding CopG/RHH family protein